MITHALFASLILAKLQPQYHLSSPQGTWLNDPCAVHYDNGTYHVHYQHVQNAAYWTPPLFWRHATAASLAGPWTDHGVSLVPSEWYDRLSVYTGSGVIWDGNTKVSFYTGVTELPITYLQPYRPGQETQNMIYSNDGGFTWQKYQKNPLIARPPVQYNVTGFRDPYVFQNEHMVKLMVSVGMVKDGDLVNFILIGSGIQNYGGMVMLYYSVNGYVDWTPMPLPLFAMDRKDVSKLIPEGMFEYSFGYNWEVPNIAQVGLDFDGTPLYMISCGTEGNAPQFIGHHQQVYVIGKIVAITVKQSKYPSFLLPVLDNGEYYLNFVPIKAGLLDHAQLYATNMIQHGKNKQQFIGWVNEDWSVQDMVREGQAGSMGIPRQMTLIRDHQGLPDVAVSPVVDSKQFRVGARHVHKPMVKLTNVRTKTDCLSFNTTEDCSQPPFADEYSGPYVPPPILPPDHSHGQNTTNVTVQYFPFNNYNNPSQVEVDMTFHFKPNLVNMPKNNFMVGVVLHHTRPFSSRIVHQVQKSGHPWGDYTVLMYEPYSRILQVSRWKSSKVESANNFSIVAHVPQSKDYAHKLNLRVFLDNSLLEVFINNRTALSTRVYPEFCQGGCIEEAKAKNGTFLGFIVSSQQQSLYSASVEDISVWSGVCVQHQLQQDFEEDYVDRVAVGFAFGFSVFILCLVVVSVIYHVKDNNGYQFIRE